VLKFKEVLADSIPMDLLLEADPSEKCVKSYLRNPFCFVAQINDCIVGSCVVQKVGNGKVEIFNIAVSPDYQKQGIGSKLLKYVLKKLLERNTEIVELGTGTFGYQLAFYQRFGFRVDAVVKDFFLKNYNEPIFENGIQLKDMLRLVLRLQ
jgi:ribosomal protein S18 acetylase RimI-like enzyme